ncbi:branched-chain amino acid ABC transporter permease [Bradyrhizobium sp. Ash2021]|uniref:branched-chain amino acid ABC transporter permease n=1 Tax=Bradyrhizobium sp. Ash2021 TaxID=2954771 RepID=UPI002814C816|nr:branched-chain amino acid ABC transporter permease [Bradyrhizobium sp. Ash2021]WMT74475.1 branched-chain amino acid ABC transporter permease [Bradyrhizobium sp. Ash2021]
MTTSLFPWITNGPLIAVQVMSGLSVGMFLFLLSVGMSLIFGVTRIVNLAHGSFYMVGAYLMAALIEVLPGNPVSFWIALVLAPIGVAVLGGVIEITLLRRVYRRDPMMQLILTFALILIIGTLDALLAETLAKHRLAESRQEGVHHIMSKTSLLDYVIRGARIAGRPSLAAKLRALRPLVEPGN